jgi:hypothetical protein
VLHKLNSALQFAVVIPFHVDLSCCEHLLGEIHHNELVELVLLVELLLFVVVFGGAGGLGR